MMGSKSKADAARELDANHLIASNPSIDPEQMREVEELLSRVRQGGVSEQNYQILSPYQPWPIQVRARSDQP